MANCHGHNSYLEHYQACNNGQPAGSAIQMRHGAPAYESSLVESGLYVASMHSYQHGQNYENPGGIPAISTNPILEQPRPEHEHLCPVVMRSQQSNLEKIYSEHDMNLMGVEASSAMAQVHQNQHRISFQPARSQGSTSATDVPFPFWSGMEVFQRGTRQHQVNEFEFHLMCHPSYSVQMASEPSFLSSYGLGHEEEVLSDKFRVNDINSPKIFENANVDFNSQARVPDLQQLSGLLSNGSVSEFSDQERENTQKAKSIPDENLIFEIIDAPKDYICKYDIWIRKNPPQPESIPQPGHPMSFEQAEFSHAHKAAAYYWAVCGTPVLGDTQVLRDAKANKWRKQIAIKDIKDGYNSWGESVRNFLRQHPIVKQRNQSWKHGKTLEKSPPRKKSPRKPRIPGTDVIPLTIHQLIDSGYSKEPSSGSIDKRCSIDEPQDQSKSSVLGVEQVPDTMDSEMACTQNESASHRANHIIDESSCFMQRMRSEKVPEESEQSFSVLRAHPKDEPVIMFYLKENKNDGLNILRSLKYYHLCRNHAMRWLLPRYSSDIMQRFKTFSRRSSPAGLLQSEQFSALWSIKECRYNKWRSGLYPDSPTDYLKILYTPPFAEMPLPDKDLNMDLILR